MFLYIVALAGIVLSFLLGGAAVKWGEEGTAAADIFGSVGFGGNSSANLAAFAEHRLEGVQLIIAGLLAVVLASVALLLCLLRKTIIGQVSIVCAFVAVALAVGQASFPMVAAAVMMAIGTTRYNFTTICVLAVVAYIVFLCVFWPGIIPLVAAALLLGFSLYVLRLMERMAKLEQSADGSADRVEDMRELLGSQRRMAKSTEHVSRLEERNRLAARIHDEIGHGMSGSILLLEGAELVMDKEPEKARETIRKVVENMRASVEKIRMVLREERSAGAEVSLARIESELMAFEADHPQIKTRFETFGDMVDVNGAVWTCVYENMVEALTNMLKHSAATEFQASLKNSGGLLRVEFADNGGPPAAGQKAFQHGIGLQNMEERAAMCYGRCFFRHEEDGFHIVMTFPRRGE